MLMENNQTSIVHRQNFPINVNNPCDKTKRDVCVCVLLTVSVHVRVTAVVEDWAFNVFTVFNAVVATVWTGAVGAAAAGGADGMVVVVEGVTLGVSVTIKPTSLMAVVGVPGNGVAVVATGRTILSMA